MDSPKKCPPPNQLIISKYMSQYISRYFPGDPLNDRYILDVNKLLRHNNEIDMVRNVVTDYTSEKEPQPLPLIKLKVYSSGSIMSLVCFYKNLLAPKNTYSDYKICDTSYGHYSLNTQQHTVLHNDFVNGLNPDEQRDALINMFSFMMDNGVCYVNQDSFIENSGGCKFNYEGIYEILTVLKDLPQLKFFFEEVVRPKAINNN